MNSAETFETQFIIVTSFCLIKIKLLFL